MRSIAHDLRRAALAVVLALTVIATATGCAARRALPPGNLPATVGVYRAQIEADDGRSRKFRLLLYVRAPDRIHGEVLNPVGNTVLILDGNGRRMSVALVRDRTAFVGEPSPEDLRKIIGSAAGVDGLVRALLHGEPPGAGIECTRDGEPDALPRLFVVRSDGNTLTLRLKRQEATSLPDAVGSGEPPPGFDQLPLADLSWDWFEEESPP